MVIDWEPFKAISHNISRGLVNEDDDVLLSEHNEDVTCLSHGRMSPRVKFKHWVATIYTENVKQLKIHIAKQLQHASRQITNKQFIFSCFLPTHHVSEAKEFVFKEFQLQYVEFFNFNLLLFEKHSASLTV